MFTRALQPREQHSFKPLGRTCAFIHQKRISNAVYNRCIEVKISTNSLRPKPKPKSDRPRLAVPDCCWPRDPPRLYAPRDSIARGQRKCSVKTHTNMREILLKITNKSPWFIETLLESCFSFNCPRRDLAPGPPTLSLARIWPLETASRLERWQTTVINLQHGEIGSI